MRGETSRNYEIKGTLDFKMHKEEMLSSLKGSRPLVLKHPEAVAATSEEQGQGNNHQHDGGVFSL